VWRDSLHAAGPGEAKRILADSGLQVPALVRGGFFHEPDALYTNHTCIDEAAAIGAGMVVLVVGAQPGLPLAEARKPAAESISHLLPHAEAAGVKLAIEPLHPMYADTRSCINRLQDATDLCEQLGHPMLGVACDVYHVWWDPDLADQIARCGMLGRLFAFHECDWRVPTRDFLNDRAGRGQGCIDRAGIRRMVETAGFTGLHEIEIFSNEGWSFPQDQWLEQVLEGYQRFG